MHAHADLPSHRQLSKPPLGCAVPLLLGIVVMAVKILPFTRSFSLFAIIAGAIALGWWYSPHTNRTRRWPIGIGIALSVLSFPLFDSAALRIFGLVTWTPIFSVLGATLLAIAYAQLDRPAPREPSWRDDLQSLSDAAQAARRKVRLLLPALWTMVAIHAASIPLFLGYTTQPCTWLDPRLSTTDPVNAIEFSPDGSHLLVEGFDQLYSLPVSSE